MLFSQKGGIIAHRKCGARFSNGDNNQINMGLSNQYSFSVQLEIIDEIPFQFQKRDFLLREQLPGKQKSQLSYVLKPVKRGEYSFGALNVYVKSTIGLVKRKYRFDAAKEVQVYPSFLQMRKYELMAISNKLTERGIKKIRKIGQNAEFEQIKTYVSGDDYRSVNWRATARSQELMVNHFQDEKSQQVYSILDKGRTMQMPFEGMTLLDYAINACLAVSNIALKSDDKAGVVTFHKKIAGWIPAEKRGSQLQAINDLLYNEKTSYPESDHEILYTFAKRKIAQRSLLLFFTNFETLTGLQRQMHFLRKLSRDHLLLVVFFENTELEPMLKREPETLDDVYLQTMVEGNGYDKRWMVKELQRFGIHALLTPPQHLSIQVINKYLEFKSRRMI
jgi:uncharacterized protein (DUF58 family)